MRNIPEIEALTEHFELLQDDQTEEENSKETMQRSAEQQSIDTLLASWKRTIEDNLFTRGG